MTASRTVQRKIAEKERKIEETFVYYGSLLTNYRLFSADREYRRVFCPSWVLVDDQPMTRERAVVWINHMSAEANNFYSRVGVFSPWAPYDVKAWVEGGGFKFEQVRNRQHRDVPNNGTYVPPLEYEVQVGFGWNGNYREWARMTLPGVYFNLDGLGHVQVPQWPSISDWIENQFDITIPGVGLSVIIGAPNWQGKGIPPVFEFGYEFDLIDALSWGVKRAIPTM